MYLYSTTRTWKKIKRTHIVERELPPSWYGTSGLLSSRCTSLLSQPSYFSSFYLDMVKLCCCFGNDISSPTTTSSDLHAFKRIRMNLTSLYSHGIYSELATLLTLRALCHFTLTSTLYVGSSNSRSSLLQFHGGGVWNRHFPGDLIAEIHLDLWVLYPISLSTGVILSTVGSGFGVFAFLPHHT